MNILSLLTKSDTIRPFQSSSTKGCFTSIRSLVNCGRMLLNIGGILLDSFFYFNMIRNIISEFFQNGIWVVGFFYFLIKTFESDRLKQISKYVMGTSLALLFVYSVMVSM